MRLFIKSHKYRVSGFFIVAAAALCLAFLTVKFTAAAENSDLPGKIEAALYNREEFFGATATVPFPTAAARTNLARLQTEFPAEVEVYVKLAELDEKLGDFENAEKELLQAVTLNPAKRQILADFYGNRGNFEKENETLEKVLTEIASPEKRLAVFSQIIANARFHDFPRYLQPEFFQQFLAVNNSSYRVVETLVEELKTDENYAAALKILRESKKNFPSEAEKILASEVAILMLQNQSKEAEAVYFQAFNPFWSETTTENFYRFLSDQDRFRAYGAELEKKNRTDPADFETAIRLIHFRNYDRSEGANSVIAKLENARREKKIVWQTDEIITVARLAILAGDGDTAARLIYTLHTADAFKTNPELRAKTLYQLFELLADAEKQRISLAGGDLKFYSDIAATDRNPGIATGILSLIFSDAEVSKKFAAKEETAVKFFNRAAAFRLFETYKNENPASSPELA